MVEFCKPGNTCSGCPAMGLGIELGAEVAETARVVHNQLGIEGLRDMTNISELRGVVVTHSRFSKEVVVDGAPYYTVIGVLRRVVQGTCQPYNDQLNEGEN